MIFLLDERVALNDTSWAFLPRWFMSRGLRAPVGRVGLEAAGLTHPLFYPLLVQAQKLVHI